MMITSRTINILLILAGLAMAVWAQTYEPKNQYLLIGGIIIIMFAIYRVSSGLSSRKKETDDDKEFVIDETFNEEELDDPKDDNPQEDKL